MNNSPVNKSPVNKNTVLSFVLGAFVASGIVGALTTQQKLVAPIAADTAKPTPNTAAATHPSAATSMNAMDATQPVRADSIEVLAEKLKARLEQQPNDMNGWVLLARSYHYMQRWDEAQAAFAKAKSLGYQGEPEPLPADTQTQAENTATPDPVFEDISRVVQQKSAQLQSGQQK